MPVVSTRRLSTTGSSSYLPPSVGGTTSSLASLGKTTTSSGLGSSNYRSSSLSSSYSSGYSSGFGSGISTTSHLSRPSYRSGLYSSSSSLGGSTRTSSYLTGGNNDSTATLSSRFGVSNYRYSRSSSEKDTITSTRGLAGKTHISSNSINNNNSLNNSNTTSSTTTASKSTSIKNKTVQTKPPIGSFSKRQSLRENRPRDNSATRPLSIPDISKIGVTSKSDSDHNANNSKLTSLSSSSGIEDRGGIRKSSSLSSSSLALQVATSGLDIYEKYSPSNYIPKCELSRSRSLSEATPGSFPNDSTVTNSSTNVHHLLQKENDHLKQQPQDDIDCVNKTVSSLSSSSLSASKENNSTQTVNKVKIKLCDAESASAINIPSTNINLNGNSKNHSNSLKMCDSSIIINNSVSSTNAKKTNSLIENPNEANINANAQCLSDNNAIYIPFAESSSSSNNKTTIDITHNSQSNSIVAKAVDAIQNSTVIITSTTSVTSTAFTTTTIRIGNSKCTDSECVSSTVVRKNSISSDAKVADTDKNVLKGNNNFSNTFVNSKGGKINKIEVSHSHIIQTIDNKETLEKLLPTPCSQTTVKKREKDTILKYHSNANSKAGKVNEDVVKPSKQPSPPPRTSSATAKNKVNNSITSSIKLKIPHAANNSLLQAAKLNLKSTKQYLSSKFDEKLIINSSYSYNLKSLNSNKSNLNNKSKKAEQSVVNGSVSTTITAKQSVQNSNKDIDNSNSNSLNQNPNQKSCSLFASTNKNNLLDFPLEFQKNKQRPPGGGGGNDHGIIGGNAQTTNIHTYNIGGGCSNQTAATVLKNATVQPTTVISGKSVVNTAQSKNYSNSNNNNNNVTSNCSDNTNNNNNGSINSGNIGYRNSTHNQFFGQTQVTSTYKDQNFLKREYEIARSQVIKNTSNAESTNNNSTLRTDSTSVDDNTIKNNTRTVNNTKTVNNNFKINVNVRDSSYISNSQEKLNKYGKNLIKPLVHKTTTNKFTAKLAKIMTNNNMNCLQNNHENLDDIKFIDSDETDRSNQFQQHLLQHQQTKSSSVKTLVANTIATEPNNRYTQETSSLSSSSSSSSPMNMRKDINIVNNKNLITSSNNSSSFCKVSNTSATAASSSAVRTVPFTAKQSDIISTIQKNNINYATDTPTHSAVSTLTNKFNSLTDLKRPPQPIISSLSNTNYYSSSSTNIRSMETTRKSSYISTTNIRPVGSAPSIVSTMATTTTTSSIKYPVPTATIATSTSLSSSASPSPKTSSLALNNHNSNAPSSRDSTPSNSPQLLRRRNILNSANSNMAQNLSQQQIKTAQLHQTNDTLPSISSSKPSSSSSASSTVIDKNLSNKLCDIEESVRSTSIRSALPPSPTLSRYNWDREGRSAISSSRNATDLDDYTSTKTSVNSSDSYDRISSETREGLCGLRNIGNTCFMNSVIQCLSHTRELTKYLKNQVGIKSSSKDQQILYEFAKLIREMWSPSTRSVTPHELKSAFSSKHRMYSGFNQQDAQEFLRFFLDSLHCALNTGTKAEQLKIDDSLSDNKKADLTWEHYSKIENSVIKDLFVGQLKSTLKCTTCGNTSVTFDPFWDLSVPLPSSSRCKLDACLDLFIREEVLDGDEMPTCSKCQTRRKCTKSLTIQRFPKYLVIHLKRFSETRWSKMSNIVEFPTGEKELNMGPYTSNSSSNSLYTLYGISNHMGSTAGGHYVALCKHPVSKKWHEFNDNVVSDEISESVLVSSSAYLLFYERAN